MEGLTTLTYYSDGLKSTLQSSYLLLEQEEEKTKYDGIGIIDQFRIKYRDEKGRKRRKIVFITTYEYRDPRTRYGFSARTFSF